MGSYDLIFLLVSAVLFITILELLRKRHLREKYAILWVAIVILIPAIALSKDFVTRLAHLLGIQYPPTFVFIGAFLGLLLLTLMLSVIDSHQTDRIIALAQSVAILEKKVKELSGNQKDPNKNNKCA